MNRIKLKDLDQYFGKEIEVQAFVENIRDLQYVQFIILRDGSATVQMTIEKSEEKNASLVELFKELPLESTIKAKVLVSENPKVKLRGMELLPIEVEVTSRSKNELPIDLKDKEKTLRETRLDYRFLDLRRKDNHFLFECETYLEHMMREYFIAHEYMEIHSPKIAAGAAESGAEVFKIDYFGEEACLSQSPQFYKQMAIAAGFDQVFEIGPAFRAENSHTSYHATEINMADVEIGWIHSFDDVMDMEEEFLKYVISKLNEKYGEEIKSTFHVDLVDTSIPFARVTFEEAKRILKEECNFVGEREDDFERQEEMLICEYFKKKTGTDFVFVTKFPFAARPFYHMLDSDGNTCSYDLLFRGIELTTGAQREHRRDILERQMIEKEIDPKSLVFYLEFFEYGCPPHGGFAIGIGRFMMQLFNIDNIREATFIYRGPTRLNP